VTAVPSA